MFCKHCGKLLPDGSRFCGGCGQEQSMSAAGAIRPTAPQNTPAYPPQNAAPFAPYTPQNAPPPPWMAQPPAAPPQKNGKGTKTAIFAVLGVLVLAALVYLAIRVLSPGADASDLAGNWYGALTLTGYTGDAAQEDAAKAARGRRLTASITLVLDEEGTGTAAVRFDTGGEALLSADYANGVLDLSGDILGGAADITLKSGIKEGARSLTGSGTAVSVSGSTRFDAAFRQTDSPDKKPETAFVPSITPIAATPESTPAPTLAVTTTPVPTPTPAVPVLSSDLLIGGEWVSDQYGDGTHDYMFFSSKIYMEYGYGLPGEGDSIDTWYTGNWSKDLYGNGTYTVEGDVLTIDWYDGTEPSALIITVYEYDYLSVANASSPEDYVYFYRVD